MGGVSATASTLFFHVETNDKGAVTEVEIFTGYKNAPSTKEGTIYNIAGSAAPGDGVLGSGVSPDVAHSDDVAHSVLIEGSFLLQGGIVGGGGQGLGEAGGLRHVILGPRAAPRLGRTRTWWAPMTWRRATMS